MKTIEQFQDYIERNHITMSESLILRMKQYEEASQMSEEKVCKEWNVDNKEEILDSLRDEIEYEMDCCEEATEEMYDEEFDNHGFSSMEDYNRYIL